MDTSNFINFSNLALIEEQYQNYLSNPETTDPLWHAFFDGVTCTPQDGSSSPLAINTYLFIDAYRRFGHLYANINPLSEIKASLPAVLDPKNYSLTSEEMLVPSFGLFKEESIPLIQLTEKLQQIYCSSIGYEFKTISNDKLVKWMEGVLEKGALPSLENFDKERLYSFLVKAESFENYLHRKFVGQKRFSLEGCETLIPLIDEILETCANTGTTHAVFGMAHRGRLNVLANILGKPYSAIFKEFDEKYIPAHTGIMGDVKYHKGYKNTFTTKSNKAINLTLAANPSHLETVFPVAEGIAKAFQDSLKTETPSKKVLPLIMHGDSAIAGQGVVYEAMQLSQIDGYSTGGSIHIVINNQIGFTALPHESRSTTYCTDIAKAFDCPVLHVNAEDVLACAKAAKLAAIIREKFGMDVFIDLIGYRKWGHNEGDEPAFTQPIQYSTIRKKPSILTLFHEALIKEGYDSEKLQKIKESFLEEMKKESSPKEEKAASMAPKKAVPMSLKLLEQVAKEITEIPNDIKIHSKIENLYKERKEMLSHPEEKKIDWAFSELLSFGLLLKNGISIRLSGQDSQRGTFAHRHVSVVNQINGEKENLIQKAAKDADATVLNSPLSEYACLGFEYGYSITAPSHLVLWEAQYGDFANSAQIIIDQYLVSGYQKWGITSNLTLLLPHGYEGQGPEHSSARVERYLQLCAQNNMTVVLPTLPSQYFHILIEQANARSPCIIFTPKAMLRHADCLSSAKDLAEGHFSDFIIADETALSSASTLILSIGKVFHDLKEEIAKRNKTGYALVSIEKLYPFNEKGLLKVLESAKSLQKVVFIQEEPQNMGAYSFLAPKIVNALTSKKISFTAACRKESASPAAGSLYMHQQEHQSIMNQVFND